MGELYELPEGWDTKVFNETVENFDKSRVPIKANERKSIHGTYPYYGSTGIIDYVDDYIFDGEFLLISEDGANLVMRTYPIAFIVTGKFWVNNHAHIVNAKTEITTNRYLELYFSSIDLKPYITGSAQPKLSQKKLNGINIPLPPLQEQKRIVAKLDRLFAKIDQAIALHQQNIDEAEGFMGSVLNEVFGELEERYVSVLLSDFASFQNGYAFKSKEFNTEGVGLRVIRIGNVLDLNKNPVYIEEKEEFSKYLLKENDIVISMTGTRTKKDYLFVRIVDTHNSYLNQRVGKITNNEKSNYGFLYYFLQSDFFRNKVFEYETGAVNQGNISGKDIMKTSIPDVSLAVQQKTVQYLDQISQKTERLKQVQQEKMQSLKDLKASLLDRAFRGELLASLY